MARCNRTFGHTALFVALLGACVGAQSAGAAEGSPITVTKSVSPNPVVAGHPVTWTLRVLNTAKEPVAHVKLADVLPLGVTNIQAEGDGFQCVVADTRVGCTAAELPVGISILTITGVAPGPTAPVEPIAASTGVARTGTVTARSQVPDGIMDTVANLRLTIGSLEKEKAGLANQVTELTAAHAQSVKDFVALKSKMESARVSSEDTAASLEGERKRSSDLLATLEATKAERDALQSSLDASNASLAASKEALSAAQQSLKDKQGDFDKLAAELSAMKAGLVMAEPLKFDVDCPAEATSHRWLLNNLPFLLDDAIANPTPRNARAFLCAQRAATSNDGFASSPASRSTAPQAPLVEMPATAVTDGKLHTHHLFKTAPTPAEMDRLRAAAESGSVEALNDWGVLVLMGVGTPQDVDLGRKYIRAAANAGSAIAAGNMAVVFELGVGVDPNRATASQWRRVAAANRG